MDWIGLWGDRPGLGVLPEIDAALDALAASGAALELNTDRISDPAGVMYPSPAILRAAQARGIPLAIDSDAHEAEHVGRLLGRGHRPSPRGRVPRDAAPLGPRPGAAAGRRLTLRQAPAVVTPAHDAQRSPPHGGVPAP